MQSQPLASGRPLAVAAFVAAMVVAMMAAVAAQDPRPAPAPAPTSAPTPAPAVAASREALRQIADTLRPSMQKKTPPRAGDWLVEHPEDGQTFDEYAASRPNRPTAKRTTLYIQPIGEFTATQQQLVKATAEYLGVVFGVPVKTEDPIADDAIPESARRTHQQRQQFLSTWILDEVLRPRRRADAVAVLGLTATDLFPEPRGTSSSAKPRCATASAYGRSRATAIRRRIG